MTSLRTLALACAPLALALVIAPAADAQGRPTPVRPVTFAASAQPGGTLVLPLRSAADLDSRGGLLDAASRAMVARALEQADFGYGPRDTQTLRGFEAFDRLLVVGLGDDALSAQTAGRVAGRALATVDGPVILAATGLDEGAVAELAAGFGMGGYRSDLYNTTRAATVTTPLTVVTDAAGAEAAYGRGAALVEGLGLYRDLANEPANVIYPETFVERVRGAFQGVRGVEITVLDEDDMERLGMGAILGSGRGSERPPRMMAVRYRGAGAPDGGPIVLAGKGITFDTGGISIKPSAGMGAMKMDMSGAGAVMGTVLALARSGAPVDVVAIAALSENMPDGSALRPADVLTAYNGRTIEIISTDAEGRLVLADAVSWADDTLNPAVIVDIATLTGAVSTALGDDYAGLFSRHDALADQLEAAGRASGERRAAVAPAAQPDLCGRHPFDHRRHQERRGWRGRGGHRRPLHRLLRPARDALGASGHRRGRQRWGGRAEPRRIDRVWPASAGSLRTVVSAGSAGARHRRQLTERPTAGSATQRPGRSGP